MQTFFYVLLNCIIFLNSRCLPKVLAIQLVRIQCWWLNVFFFYSGFWNPFLDYEHFSVCTNAATSCVYSGLDMRVKRPMQPNSSWAEAKTARQMQSLIQKIDYQYKLLIKQSNNLLIGINLIMFVYSLIHFSIVMC